MIHIGSRYQNSPVVYMLDGRTGGTRPTVLRDNTDIEGTSTVSAFWADSSRLDTVGSSLFDEPEQWWRVMDLNPEILDPLSLTAGTLLRIQ